MYLIYFVYPFYIMAFYCFDYLLNIKSSAFPTFRHERGRVLELVSDQLIL